jgi:hypothetical protein
VRLTRISLGRMTSHSSAQPPVPVWEGRPSGAAFGDILRRRAEQVGVHVEVDVQPWAQAGGYGVGAAWGDAPEDEFFCEVSDWVGGVRILDAGDADVTVEVALTYFEARLRGASVRAALEASGAWPKSWFRRWRERRTRGKLG